jgi:signal peptidase II
MRPTRGWPLFALVVACSLAADLATKEAVFARLGMPGEGRRVIFVPGVFELETNLNEGALFGMGQGLSWLFATVSVAALIGILAMLSRPAARESGWLLVALALICGGILGNLYDRLGVPGLAWHAPPERVGQPVYAVRDWIHVTIPGVIDWPIFNLADSWLVIGAGMLVLASFQTPAAAEPAPPA